MKASSSRFSWKKNKLYFDHKPTHFSVCPLQEVNPNSEFKSMFKIKIDKSVTTEADYSADFYNLTRAKDNAIKLYRKLYDAEALGGTAGAFK